MEKKRILYEMAKNDFMIQLHRDTINNLVGTMIDEYQGKAPHYEQLHSPTQNHTSTQYYIPILHSTISALTGYLFSGVVEKITDEILQIIDNIENNTENTPE